jgi:aminoglycoside phosphotransferase
VRALIQNILIEPALLRLLWAIVSELHEPEVLSLPDAELSQLLYKQVSGRTALNPEQNHSLASYISSKLMLIRDIAETR